MFDLLAGAGLLVLVQAASPALPPVNKLHEVFNALAVKRGSALRIDLSACQRDRMGRATCHYSLNRQVTFVAEAEAAGAPLTAIAATLPGGPAAAERMVSAAGALAIGLIPDLPRDDLVKLMNTLNAKSTDVFDAGERTAQAGDLEFRLVSDSRETVLRITSLAGTCRLGVTC